MSTAGLGLKTAAAPTVPWGETMPEISSDDSGPQHTATAVQAGWVYKLVRAGALMGGFVFLAMVGMLIVTIVGRKLFNWQVPGDVELVQMGAAFASAPFFAWCHLERGDVKVDFLTQKLPLRWINVLEALGSMAVGLFGALMAWRTLALAISTAQGGEISPILGWPAWYAQALMVPGFVLLALAGFYSGIRFFRQEEQGPHDPLENLG